MRKARLAAAGLALGALTSGPAAQAQVTLDVTKITCSQFLAYKIVDPKHIALWISGYYHGTHGDPTLDTQGLLQNVDKVEQYCFKNPNVTVIKAASEVLGSGK